MAHFEPSNPTISSTGPFEGPNVASVPAVLEASGSCSLSWHNRPAFVHLNPLALEIAQRGILIGETAPAFMSTCPIALNPSMMALGSATWNATAKEVASSAHRLVSTVRDRATVVVIAAKLWQVHRAMGNMLEDFYSKVEHPVPLTEPLDEDKLRAGLSSLRNLSDAIGQIALGLRQKGLANRSYIAAPMNSLKVYSDQLLDIVEAAELMLDPSSYGAAEAKFAKSLEELRTGETVKLESIL